MLNDALSHPIISNVSADGTGETVHQFIVPAIAAGDRIDRILANLLAPLYLSRSQLQGLIVGGRLQLDDCQVLRPSVRVRGGERCRLVVPPARPAWPEPQPLPLTIVHEDDHLLVIDKPAGLVVHPAPGNVDQTLVNALLAYCGDSLSGIGGVRRPGIVHRLDKDTSGLMVVARTDAAHRQLCFQFQDRTLSRGYQAVVLGAPQPATGSIDCPIGRDTNNRKRMAVTATGKPAVTKYTTLARFGPADRPAVAAHLALELSTGRTHQIRVHLRHIGCPVVGDPTYGRLPAHIPSRHTGVAGHAALVGMTRQALHAATLRFQHPADGQFVRFDSPLPADIAYLLRELGLSSLPLL